MPHRLQLDRPLAFVDLETTGLLVDEDRIVELAVVKLLPSGEREARSRLIHPGRPIPADATAIHGIRDEDVADAPRFAQVARDLHTFLSDCDLAGYNLESFDLRVLTAEFRRCGLEFPGPDVRRVDPLRIFQQRESRNLAAAVRFYCGRPMEGAHRALTDVEATIDVLLAQVDRYPELGVTAQTLHDASHPRQPSWVDDGGRLVWSTSGEMAIGFGKHRGRPLRDMAARQADYLRWMCTGDFSVEVRGHVAAALRGEFSRRASPPAPADPSDT